MDCRPGLLSSLALEDNPIIVLAPAQPDREKESAQPGGAEL